MLCFRKLPVAKKLMNKRGGSINSFRRKFFCLTVPKNFVWEPFSVSLISGTEKFFMLQKVMSRFSVEFFLFHSAENFRRGIPYCCNNFR